MVALIPALPLFAFILIIFTGFKLKEKAAWVSIAALAGSLMLSIYTAFQIFPAGDIELNLPWLKFASFSLHADLISGWMMLLVSGVGLLIQIYSTGYM